MTLKVESQKQILAIVKVLHLRRGEVQIEVRLPGLTEEIRILEMSEGQTLVFSGSVLETIVVTPPEVN